jgi:hypothetical protein
MMFSPTQFAQGIPMNERTNIYSAAAPQEGREPNSGITQGTEVSRPLLRPAGIKRRGRKTPEPKVISNPTVVGSKIRLARKPMCCKGLCIIAMAKEPYAGEFICAGCGKHRAWMSHKVAKFIEETQRRLGAPEIITVGTAEERRELNNRDYELPDGARIEVVNPAYPPRLYLSRLYKALPTPNKKDKLSVAKTQAKVIAVGKAYREIADAIAFLSERYSKHNVHIILKQRQEAPAIKRLDDEGNETNETRSKSATEGDHSVRASDMFPSKYLMSSDVKDKPMTATVSHITQELVGQGKDAEKKPILHFKDAKSMVLNKTNAVTLDAAFGDTDNWS